MSERISGLPAPVQNVLQRAGEIYDGFRDSLDEQRANDAIRGLISSELDNVFSLVGRANEVGLVDRLTRAAVPLFGDQPNAEAVARMAEMFASDDDVRSQSAARGYNPDLIRDLLRERLLPSRG